MKNLVTLFIVAILIISCRKNGIQQPSEPLPGPLPPTDTISVKPLTISGFKFEKSKNPELPADISAAKIIHGAGTAGKIYVFVPEGTDFSRLTATITSHSGNLYYTQNPADAPVNINTVYPTNGKLIDYTYPKTFYAVLKKGDESRLYQVIVDIDQPFGFEHPEVSVKDVKEGTGKSQIVTTLENRRNHPLTLPFMSYPVRVPQGAGPIRCSTAIPSLGLKPGERVDVSAVVSAQTYPVGDYKTNVSFAPRIYGEEEADELLKPSVLIVNSNVIR